MRLIDADAYAKRLSALAKNAENNAMPMTAAQFKWTADDMKENAPTIGDWMRVEDGLPETRHAVLVYTPHHKNIWAASMHEDGNWYIWSPGGKVLLDPDWHGPITHWMPLPEPPKEVKKKDETD